MAISGLFARLLQRYLKPKGRPNPDAAAHADLAAHRLHQLLADGKTQAGSPISPGHRAIGLGEFLEQTIADILGYAHPAIVDLKTKMGKPGCWVIQLVNFHLHRHAAFFREFDGVSDEGQQYLAKPR